LRVTGAVPKVADVGFGVVVSVGEAETMVTTTPSPEELSPTAKQVVELEQATPKRYSLPDTVRALPGVPLVMGTTTPSKEEFKPTA
jgi:hypothetical protein